MKFYIKHETRGRLRIHLAQKRMSYGQADTLLYYLENLDGVASAKVYERTCDAVVNYRGSRAAVIRGISEFHYQDVEVPSQVLQSSGRALNAEYQEKLISKVICHYGRRLFLPYPLNAIYTTATSLKYIWKGIDTLLHRKIEVPVLDATAIGVSVLRQDFGTAGSIMFLLGIGEILEEWTHKKSVGDLARTMSLNVGRVWLKREDQEILVESGEVQPGDDVVVRMGTVIPFDGSVTDGEAMVCLLYTSALARMMIGEPEAILLDEPFSALDGYLKDVLQREMQDFLKDYPGDMILVTHSRDEAYKFCRELSIVHEGRILVTGETKQLFERPGLLEAAKLTGCKNFSRAERLGPHEIYAADWKMKLHTEENVDMDITHVGIRGHWIRPESKPGENCMAVRVDQYIETTFEHQYMIRNKAEENAAGLWWMRPKNSFTEDPDKDLPEYLYLPPEHLMLLK